MSYSFVALANRAWSVTKVLHAMSFLHLIMPLAMNVDKDEKEKKEKEGKKEKEVKEEEGREKDKGNPQ